MSDYLLDIGEACCPTCRPAPCDSCGPGVECCLYPWPYASDPDYDQDKDNGGASEAPPYPASDLPEELTLNVSKYDPASGVTTFPVTMTRGDGYLYQGTDARIDGGGNVGLQLWTITGFGWQWAVLANYAVRSNVDLCLASTGYESTTGTGDLSAYEFGVFDNFPDTLHVDGQDPIHRGGTSSTSGSCAWTGAKTGGGVWSLDYGLTTPYKWHLASYGGAGGSTAADKAAPQSSPAGSYGAHSVSLA